MLTYTESFDISFISVRTLEVLENEPGWFSHCPPLNLQDVFFLFLLSLHTDMKRAYSTHPSIFLCV